MPVSKTPTTALSNEEKCAACARVLLNAVCLFENKKYHKSCCQHCKHKWRLQQHSALTGGGSRRASSRRRSSILDSNNNNNNNNSLLSSNLKDNKGGEKLTEEPALASLVEQRSPSPDDQSIAAKAAKLASASKSGSTSRRSSRAFIKTDPKRLSFNKMGNFANNEPNNELIVRCHTCDSPLLGERFLSNKLGAYNCINCHTIISSTCSMCQTFLGNGQQVFKDEGDNKFCEECFNTSSTSSTQQSGGRRKKSVEMLLDEDDLIAVHRHHQQQRRGSVNRSNRGSRNTSRKPSLNSILDET